MKILDLIKKSFVISAAFFLGLGAMTPAMADKGSGDIDKEVKDGVSVVDVPVVSPVEVPVVDPLVEVPVVDPVIDPVAEVLEADLVDAELDDDIEDLDIDDIDDIDIEDVDVEIEKDIRLEAGD